MIFIHWASQVALVVKNLPANAKDIRDAISLPGSRRSPGVGNGNTLQYSCLENPMERGAWWATVHEVANSWTQLKQLCMPAFMIFMGIPLVAQRAKNHLQCRRLGFSLWLRKIPWRREWLPTPIFLPGESHGQRSP